MKLRVCVALAAFVPIVLSSLTASAQMSDNEKKAAARAAYTEGSGLQDAGKYAEALADFEKAEKLFDAPTHLLHIAQCQAQVNKLVEASETYELLTHETLEKGAPDAFVQAQTQGGKELEALKPRIPTLRVNVKPEPATLPNLQINLNDKTLPIETIGIARPINPGNYKITATATAWGTVSATIVDIKEKDAKIVDLTLEKGAGGGATDTTKTKPVEEDLTGPSPTGLLIGVRPLGVVPFGNVDDKTKFKTYAGAGGGVGIEVIGRVVQRFLVGGSLQGAILGGPSGFVPSNAGVLQDASVKVDSSNVKVTTEYAGVIAGFMPDVDKVSLVGFVSGGYRFIQRDVTLNLVPASGVGPGRQVTLNDNVNGYEVGLNGGVSIPAGPMRLVPLLNFDGGILGSRACVDVGKLDTTKTAPQCNNPGSGTFFLIGVSVGVYYDLDFGRKPAGTTAKSKNLTHFAF